MAGGSSSSQENAIRKMALLIPGDNGSSVLNRNFDCFSQNSSTREILIFRANTSFESVQSLYKIVPGKAGNSASIS